MQLNPLIHCSDPIIYLTITRKIGIEDPNTLFGSRYIYLTITRKIGIEAKSNNSTHIYIYHVGIQTHL
jgi:hypothetical protein